MLIDFSQTVKTIYKKDWLDEKGSPLKLSTVAIEGLMFDGGVRLSEEVKLRKWVLAQKLLDAAEIEVSDEEIALIKSAINGKYETGVSGSAMTMLTKK